MTRPQWHPLTSTHCNPELQPLVPGTVQGEQVKLKGIFFSLPFFRNHDGEGLETSWWDGHRGELRLAREDKEPSCCLSAAWWRGTPALLRQTGSNRPQSPTELWLGNCLQIVSVETTGHHMTVV